MSLVHLSVSRCIDPNLIRIDNDVEDQPLMEIKLLNDLSDISDKKKDELVVTLFSTIVNVLSETNSQNDQLLWKEYISEKP
jgi:hypothetical protein